MLAGLRILVEERVQAFEDGGPPATEKLRVDIVLAAQLRLAGASPEVDDDLCLELIGKGTSRTWHGKVSLGGPVLTSILVQRQGRIARLVPSRLLCGTA